MDQSYHISYHYSIGQMIFRISTSSYIQLVNFQFRKAMIFDSKIKKAKLKASHSQKSQMLGQFLDSNSIVINNYQKYNLFPSCETQESLSYVQKSEQSDEKETKKSILEGILKFDQSLLFQHAMQLYESKAALSIEENGQHLMNNCDFSFNAQFLPHPNQQKSDSKQQVKKYRPFLLKIGQIKNNNIALSRDLIQIKKELIRFHHEKHFIFEDIKTKICKKVGHYITYLSQENKKLKNMIQSGLQYQKRSKQNQFFLSQQHQLLNQRIVLLNQKILEKQKQIQRLNLQNQALIRQNEELFFKTSIGSFEVDYFQQKQPIFNNTLPYFQSKSDQGYNVKHTAYNEEQQLTNFKNILCNLMKSSNMDNQLRFSMEQISIQCKKLFNSTIKIENHDQIHKIIQKNKLHNRDCKQLPFKIQYSLLIIFALQNWSIKSIKSQFNNDYFNDYFTPQSLLKQLTSIWLHKQEITSNKAIEKTSNDTKLICSPSSRNIQNSPQPSMAETHESDLGGDSLSLSKSRSKISLMHDKIQQIKKKISGK